MTIRLHTLVIRIERIENFHRSPAFEQWEEREPMYQDYWNYYWKRCYYWLWWCLDVTLQVTP